jgi:hypothetical protein
VVTYRPPVASIALGGAALYKHIHLAARAETAVVLGSVALTGRPTDPCGLGSAYSRQTAETIS